MCLPSLIYLPLTFAHVALARDGAEDGRGGGLLSPNKYELTEEVLTRTRGYKYP